MTPESLAERLGGRRSGDGWVARCPAHDDRNASLSIRTGDGGRTLAKCHAGCPFEAIVRASGIESADLFPEPTPINGTSRIKRTYDYRDERDELLFQVVRKTPKGFFQRRPNGAGGFINGLGDARRVLYRLPELLAADWPCSAPVDTF